MILIQLMEMYFFALNGLVACNSLRSLVRCRLLAGAAPAAWRKIDNVAQIHLPQFFDPRARK